MRHLERKPWFERAVVRRAALAWAKGAAERLSDFADERAHDGDVALTKDELPRDLLLEAREELADCRNYLAWEYQRRATLKLPRSSVAVALARVVDAWAELERIESDDKGER